MKTMTAQEMIICEYGSSKNFMTPEVLEQEKINESHAYELSKGTGLSNEPIWGVSIVKQIGDNKTKRCTELGDCFFSLEDAKEHINNLKSEL